VRIECAKMTAASVSAGNQTLGKSSRIVALLGTTLTPGKIGIHIESTNHRTVAMTNSGSVIAITLN